MKLLLAFLLSSIKMSTVEIKQRKHRKVGIVSVTISGYFLYSKSMHSVPTSFLLVAASSSVSA